MARSSASRQGQQAPIVHLGRWRRIGLPGNPWALQDEYRTDKYMVMLRALHEGCESAVWYFFSQLDKKLPAGAAVALVPGHDPALKNCGLDELGRALGGTRGRVDATSIVVRTTAVPRLAVSSPRGLNTHLSSVAICRPEIIRGRRVVLLDDIAYTGNSIRAARRILEEAGAQSVQCIVLGRGDPAILRPVRSSSTRGTADDRHAECSTTTCAQPGHKTASKSTRKRRPTGQGPDDTRRRQHTKPLVVDSAPGSKYDELLRRFGATGDVD